MGNFETNEYFLSETFSKASSLSFVKNENKMGGLGPRFMPATPIFLKHQFSKNGPKNLTKVENFKFLLFLLYRDLFPEPNPACMLWPRDVPEPFLRSHTSYREADQKEGETFLGAILTPALRSGVYPPVCGLHSGDFPLEFCPG